jgi:hypothetical protein
MIENIFEIVTVCVALYFCIKIVKWRRFKRHLQESKKIYYGNGLTIYRQD